MAKSTKTKKQTPLMAQYFQIKEKYNDAILLFRVGDFYETFGKDAIVAAKVLGIVQTKRHNGSASEIELAGFPYHSLNVYLPKLVKAGYRVAICEQLEEPSKGKKIVRRGVTELITPGVAVDDNILDHRSNNFLASVYFGKQITGVAFVDISTGEFLVADGSLNYIEKLLQTFAPSEVIYPKQFEKQYNETIGNQYYSYKTEDWLYQLDHTKELLERHFEVNSLKGYGIEDNHEIIQAAGAVLQYLGNAEHQELQHITGITKIFQDKYVWLDRFSIRNLELIHSNHPDGKSLVDVIDNTASPMGARLLKKWVLLPLVNTTTINERLNNTEFLANNTNLRFSLIDIIKKMGDLERLISKVPLKKINPREVVYLKKSLLLLEPIQDSLAKTKHKQLMHLADKINLCAVLIEKLDNEIAEDAPALLSKGNVIADGVNADLDEYRNISKKGKAYLAEIQQREAEKTGIQSLKIGFNNVFGYYLEVRNTYKDKVPESWIRKQTLTSAERYITEELKEYEQKILSAHDKIQELEAQLFDGVVDYLQSYIQQIQSNAQLVAELDCLLSFAETAANNNYCKPVITNEHEINIKNGRHPVIEAQLPVEESFVPNDVLLNNYEQQIIMITGPNMSGKSAVLRQTALICLMAQMGSFVPAQSAEIGYLDKIFTRVGASDNISSGESTFMVEMNETANIVNNVSNRSLILLDEIGRGTSTYDGISIAWSLAEYLHNHPKCKPLTLFATHYHELNELADKYSRIKNYNVSTKEVSNKVIFLRKLMPGGSKHSFGIHVAKLAGMPKTIIERANEILVQLEDQHIDADMAEKVKNIQANNYQLNIFGGEVDKQAQAIKKALEKIDINTYTPVEALMKLNELLGLLKEDN